MPHPSHTTSVLALVVTAIACGGTDPPHERIPLPDPSSLSDSVRQQTVAGSVQNTAFESIAGARITIAGTSLSAVTDAGGRFQLQGSIDPKATIQVAKEGYVTQSREVSWVACVATPEPCRQGHVIVILNTLAPAIDITGDYTLRIVADTTCGELPGDARDRTYTASIASVHRDNTSLEVTIRGASLYASGSSVFYAGVAGDRFSLRLDGSWVDQAFMEEVARNTYVGYSGFAAATVAPRASTISATLDGSITACRTSEPLIEPSYSCVNAIPGQPLSRPDTHVACYSKNHRMVFSPL
jgi:hypothetical protein